MNSQNGLVPLALLATELEIDIAALAEQFGDDVVPDAAGLRCVPIERCREYIAATHAARRADEERMQTQIAECVARIDRIERAGTRDARGDTGPACGRARCTGDRGDGRQ